MPTENIPTQRPSSVFQAQVREMTRWEKFKFAVSRKLNWWSFKMSHDKLGRWFFCDHRFRQSILLVEDGIRVDLDDSNRTCRCGLLFGRWKILHTRRQALRHYLIWEEEEREASIIREPSSRRHGGNLNFNEDNFLKKREEIVEEMATAPVESVEEMAPRRSLWARHTIGSHGE